MEVREEGEDMTVVNYEQVLQILYDCAKKNMTAQEAYNYVVFAFGEPKKPAKGH